MDLRNVARLLSRDPWQGRMVIIMSLVLVIGLGRELALIAWQVMAPSMPSGTEAPVASGTGVAPEPGRIVAQNLFGQSGNAGPAASLSAPETRLNLTLRGIAAASASDNARAIIAGPDGVERVYAIGASVPGGATIREILTDRILLNRRGTLETLRLPRHAPASTPIAQAPPVGQIVDNLAEQSVAGGGDQDALAEVVRPQAVLVDGRLLGFRIYPGRDRQKFTALGLRAGDLVTAINGVALTDPATSMDALQAIAGTSQAVLTLERGGQIESLTIRIDQ